MTLLIRHLGEVHRLVANRANVSGALQRLGKTRQSLHVFVDEFELDGVTG